jgi:hypothetical protein
VVAALAACSFRGGDHAPLVKPPSTPCSLEAEAFCKEQLTSEDPSTCIARETYRCEIREEAARRAAETKETAPGSPPP